MKKNLVTPIKYLEKKLIEKIKYVDFVGVSILTESFKNAQKIIYLIKKNNPNLPIIIGGPHCTLFPKKSLEETEADICVQGEGEYTLIEIINNFNNKINLKNISGLTIKINNNIITGKPPIPIENIDSLPFPSRDLVKNNIYGIGLNPNAKKGEYTSIITSRGCPFSCKFCQTGQNSGKMRHASIDTIINWIKKCIVKKNLSNS